MRSVVSKRAVGVVRPLGVCLVFGLVACLLSGACVDLDALQGSSLEAGSALDAGDGSLDGRGSADANQEPPPAPPSDSGPADSPADRHTNVDAPAPPLPDAGAPECPISEPTGGACVHPGAVCEYGTNPIETCNSVWTCSAKGWTPTVAAACPTSPCPATYTDLSGTFCTPNDLGCNYAGVGICICGLSGFEANPTWTCVPETAGCAAPRPRLGRPCESTATCDYGNCSGGIEIQCLDGYWQRIDMGCPG